VARNRKRRNDRRSRQPGDGTAARPGLATANGARRDESADPLEHAAPDVELAEAQLALGRPELADVVPAADEPLAADEGDESLTADEGDEGDDLQDVELEGDYDEDDEAGDEAGEPRSRRRRELAPSASASPSPRGAARLVQFVQGSWRELQRVQWPDRRQVMQATGVVIGFVIVAGVFLGVADLLATKLVNLIIK
jgi:preprotein translocase subunit SecE